MSTGSSRLIIVFKYALGLILSSLLPFGLAAQIQLGPDRVVISNVTDLNSTELDWAPSYYKDGLVYVSTTRSGKMRKRLRGKRRSDEYMRLWHAMADTAGTFTQPSPFFEKYSGAWHEGPATFDSTFTICFFSRNPGKSLSRSARRAGLGRQQMIFSTAREGESWLKPLPVPFNEASSHSAHPALSPDGKLLIFASDRDGGYGGMDLWAVEWDGSMWGQPFNLGNVVNSGGNDLFPFIHPDGTLYYATTVLGESEEQNHLDIVYTRVERGAWTNPQPLGEPFNTPYDDFGLIVSQDNQQGYFSSTRPGGIGKDDLYRFSITGPSAAPAVNLQLAVSDAATGEPLQGAAIELLNTSSLTLGKAIAAGVVSDSGLVVSEGKVYMTDPTGLRSVSAPGGNYLVAVRREGYLGQQMALALDRNMRLPVRLSPKPTCNTLRITVLEEQSLLPINDVQVKISGQLSGQDPLEALTDEQGAARICLPCGDVYGLVASRSDYKSRPGSVDLRGADCASAETSLTLYISRREAQGPAQVAGTPLNPGTVMQLPSVFYASSSWALSESAKKDLDRLGDLMKQFPDMHIALGSHTDSQGDAGFNQRLSQRRAEEAKQYLEESRGISPKRIIAIGYGESELRNGCVDGIYCNAGQHRVNRRTEVSILDAEGAANLAEVVSSGQLSKRYARPAPQMQPIAPSEAESPGYWVVAGTAETDGEAKTLLARLKGMGYNQAEVSEVEGLKGRLVVAARFKDLKDAAALSRKLRDAHRLNSYVRKAK